MLDAILFDLDGTLLPMDMDVFTHGYFSMLAEVAAPYGYEKGELVKSIWQGTAAMVRNDGAKTNRERFWDDFAGHYGDQARAHEAVFDSFYTREFRGAVKYAFPDPPAAQRAVSLAHDHARQVILATEKAGIKSFLVLDCLIKKDGMETSSPQGSFSDMLNYLEQQFPAAFFL